MKIVSLPEFLALPAGTIYSDYEPTMCTGLNRKGNTIQNPGEEPIDFFYASLVAECLNEGYPTVDAIESRWGEYDHRALFAIYEPADLEILKSMLNPTETKPDQPEPN